MPVSVAAVSKAVGEMFCSRVQTETTMIDTVLTLPLELMALTALVGFGMLYSYNTRRTAPIDAEVSRPYDMRRDGQRFGLQSQIG
jgi:uncharacterized membrane protein